MSKDAINKGAGLDNEPETKSLQPVSWLKQNIYLKNNMESHY